MIKNQVLKEIMKKYELKEGMWIGIDLINKISCIEKIDVKDLACMLQINSNTMYRLKTNRQKRTKLILKEYYEIEDRKIRKSDEITYEEFNELKNKMNVKDYTLIGMLGISVYSYYKLKQGKVLKVRIKNMKVKHIVDLIKIDLYYLKESGYHSIKKLKELCKRKRISLKQFIKYYNNNPKHQKFNKMIVEKSLKGFWISKETRIPEEFIDKNYGKILHGLEKVANKVSSIWGCKRFNEDLVHETMIELYQKCGDIVQNFYFDMKVLFNILMSKAKYIMIDIYRKKYKQDKDISYDSFEDNYIEHTNILRDDRFDPQLLFE